MTTLVSKFKFSGAAWKKGWKYVESRRVLSTKTQLNAKNEPREITLKYLDGKDNGIVVLGLNRPDSRNAFGKNFVSQMFDALSMVRKNDNIRVIVVQSLVPNIFSAGADLRERRKMCENEVKEFVSSLRSLMNEVEALPTPSISAIDGVALGGGLELALATDIRTASDQAKMGLVETKLAIIPGAGGTQRLPRLIGTARAKELIYTARILDGKQAENIGLVNQSVPQNKNGDAAYQAALTIAREILPNGPVGVRMAKKAITQGTQVPMENGYEIEKKCYDELLKTEDRIEGLAAFATKRIPIYRGV